MATKSGQEAASTEHIEELLDAVDSTLDRLKTLYEQYFLGIHKQAPAFIHSDVERKLRDLTQLSIRNTGLRYRLAMLQQKLGSYNSYWRRTLRQIENGTYVRNLAKIGREAARSGLDIPEEILAVMPKRMREQVLRDRDQAIAIARRRKQLDEGAADDEISVPDQAPAQVEAPAQVKTSRGAHVLEDEGELDFSALFSVFEDDAPQAESVKAESVKAEPSATQARTRPVSRPPLPRMPVPHESAPRRAGVTGTPPGGTTSAVPRPVAAQIGPVAVESRSGALPRMPAEKPVSAPSKPPAPPHGTTQAVPKPPPQAAPKPAAPLEPPPGMTEADVNALHATYVKAKEMVGEKVDPGSREKLLKTINQTAPKIMEQYNASGVDFSVVVKDNQVVLKAKPKT